MHVAVSFFWKFRCVKTDHGPGASAGRERHAASCLRTGRSRTGRVAPGNANSRSASARALMERMRLQAASWWGRPGLSPPSLAALLSFGKPVKLQAIQHSVISGPMQGQTGVLTTSANPNEGSLIRTRGAADRGGPYHLFATERETGGCGDERCSGLAWNS
jgi:hypothetical protein